MWQRIQTIYLFLAAVSVLLISFLFPLFVEQLGQVEYLHHHLWVALMIYGGAILNFVSIFKYGSRKLQVVLGRLSILLLAAGFLYLLWIYYGKSKTSEAIGFGIAFIAPLVGIFFTSLANKAIMKDEEKVRSADRLR